ncbi:acylneuraminate cytidylyltransferase [Candidatus Nitrosarchaeum limnium SFB1]|jgi:spore coat polysaccharide biosynthesis protein SpsF (cytidylyltransferase family)|uniref:Acylneuraminate cytidylyltransferase n=1 Tax=Candidatus Nitrosarchaeum limnium SFB1 TaxID=886738 RepID=F3KMX0_9ARCH|nr:acylneuraminate cytidylyltransferase [Candidatus Nitrosarchaeum limnium SFB1]
MIGCIIQARMGSTRLPGKVMEKIDSNHTIIDYVINQLKYSKKIEKIIVATTNLTEDDVINKHIESQKIDCFRGSSEDVLDRYYNCAKKFAIDIIVRITADNPLIDPNIVDLVVDEYKNNRCDFATNTIHRTFPYGTEVEVFSFKSLENAWKNAKKPSEREHVTPFIRDTQNGFILINIKNQEDLSYLRYTVDRIEDLKLVKEIVENIVSRPVLIEDVTNLYKKRPEIFEINKNIKHDGHLSSLKKDELYLSSQKHEGTTNVKD